MQRRLMAAAAAGVLSGALALTGCAPADNGQMPSMGGHGEHGSTSMPGSAMPSSGGMEHPMDGGPAPAGITPATDATYPVGTKFTLTADHMPGMNGAKATIAGAYRTYTYAVDFTPTTGGNPVKDHRWVVQEEIANAGDQRLADRSQVTLLAEHMAGMKGAKATIASSTDETVYMVDYEADGMMMTNHKWVVESEIRPAS